MIITLTSTSAVIKLAGLLLSKYTQIFDYIGMVFYPILAIFNVPEPILIGKAAALSFAECGMAALVVTEASLLGKYIIGVMAVSNIVMLAGTVPCFYGTDIPINMKQITATFFVRAFLSMILAAIFGVIFL